MAEMVNQVALPTQKSEPWETFLDRVRELNFALGTLVTQFENCVQLQGTPKEDVQLRIAHAKKREETRRHCLKVQEDLMTHMQEGTTADNRSLFFTECFNYTVSVDRYMKGLGKSMSKETLRLQANRKELDAIQGNNKLTDAERQDAIEQCKGVEEITKEKETTISKIKDEMSNIVQQLRYQASADVAQAQVAETIWEEEEMEKLPYYKKRAPYIVIAGLFLLCVILGSVKWYFYWTSQ